MVDGLRLDILSNDLTLNRKTQILESAKCMPKFLIEGPDKTEDSCEEIYVSKLDLHLLESTERKGLT